MNVLFLMISFPNDLENSNLYTDLAHEFKKEGHSVYVAVALEEKYKQPTQYKDEFGLNVLRIKCANQFDIGFIEKGIGLLRISYQFKKAIKENFSGINFDLIIYPTPPITFTSVVSYLKKRFDATSYLILRDIFPANARDIGIMTNPLLYYFFRHLEKRMYAVSDFIGCMSPKNIEYVAENNQIENDKLKLLPNWKKIEKRKREKIPKDLVARFQLDKKTIALFGGVTGMSQELTFLLDLAESCLDKKGLLFLIIGEGNQKPYLKSIIREKGLTNVIFADRLPTTQFRSLLSYVDIGLVNLNRNYKTANIPSKTLDFFDAEIPILAAIDPCTDYADVLDESGAGLWSITGDLEGYKRNLESLLSDSKKRKAMGKKGRKYLEKNLSVSQAYDSIVSLL